MPEVGDKIVCLRNDHEIGLLNGSVWFVEEVEDRGPHAFLMMNLRSEDGEDTLEKVDVYREGFQDPAWRAFENREAQSFDYAYALTCHKSQGSQWDDVVIINESSIFGHNKHRWLYTAITRAAERVTIFLRG